ncbi:MAG: diadenylate cyclase CdaA [Bacteroidales bacterium]|nr:diadenylate cyclase CdaA [Bacteroidales bacterium]
MFLLFQFRVIDIIDILIVAFLFFQLYQLIKETTAIYVFIGIVAVYFIWKLVNAFEMQLLGEILQQFVNVGVIALIVVFQKEIRQFLLLLGTAKFFNNETGLFSFLKQQNKIEVFSQIMPIVSACNNMSNTQTGALIVIAKRNKLKEYIETGEALESNISEYLIENIFFKNSPLHDGAIIIIGDKIKAARCILPQSDKMDIPVKLGLRHRAAIGITQLTDAIAIVVSEQTGEISFCKNGLININLKAYELKKILENEFFRQK